MKKTLAWLLTLFMVLTISSVTVFAAGTDVAKIGDVGYSSFEEALNAVQDGETITLVAGATGDEHSTEIKFEKKIEFTVTGKAPDYAIPVITFENATVNIEDAEFMTAELDARKNATINVHNSNIKDVGGNSIVKSYYNGAINIAGTSEVYTMQVTTMGYITVSDTAKLNATWQTNVYGNGLITVEDTAVLATGALNLTGKDYEGRDNTDTDRVGEPATVVVDGATLKVGEVYSSSGADYSYNADSYGINVGTISGKAALFDIKNGANVSLRMQNNGTVNFGADATVNVADSALKVICRGEGQVTLNNNGLIKVQGDSTLNIPVLSGTAVYVTDDTTLTDTVVGGAVHAGYGANKTDSLELAIAGNFQAKGLYVGNKYEHYTNGEVHTLTIKDGAVVNVGALYVRPTCVATVTNATVNAGDLFVRGSLTVDGSTMSHKSAIGGGTGHWTVYEDDDATKTATLTLNNSAVSTNYLVVGSNSNSETDADSNATLTVNGGSLTLSSCLYVQGSDTFKNNSVSFTDTTVTAKKAYLHKKAATNVYGQCTITIDAVTGDNTVDCQNGATLKDSTIGGEVFVAGKVTFRGDNTFGMLSDFGTLKDYYGTTADMEWSVDAGASVTLTNEARYGLGYGDKVTIFGSLADALTARATLTEGDIAVFMHGLVAQESAGWNKISSLTVKNAYVVLGSNNSFGNKPGNYGGTYTFTFDNVVLDSSRITFYAADSKTNFTFNESDVEVGTFMIRDTDTVFTLIDTKLVSTTDTNGTDEGNYLAGKLVLKNSRLSYKAPLVMENGTLTLDKTSSLTAPSITGAGKIVIDTTGKTAGEVTWLDADLSDFNGTVEVVGDESLYAYIKNGKIYLKNVVAKIGDVYYDTLEEALAAVGAGDVVIELLNDATLDYPARSKFGVADTTSITINGNDKTLTLHQTDTDWSSIGMANANGKLVLNNMTINKTSAGGNDAWNNHAINFHCDVEMNNVTVNNSVAVHADAVLNNVDIVENGEYYGLWITADGQTVTMNGGSITAINGGRGIKIADQYLDAVESVTLNVTGTTFTTAKKAAILVTSTEGAAITVSNIDISGVVEDTIHAVWMDEDRGEHFDKVTVVGGNVLQEGKFACIVIKNDAICGYYKTLEAAFADASDGDTVILLNNISDSVDYNVNKTLTLDLNGYTIESDAPATLTATAGKLTIVDNSTAQTGAIIGAKAIHSSAYVAIQSGKFVGTITTDNGQADDSQVCITGGNFSVEPNPKLVKHTYIVVPAEDETYNVIPDEYEVIIIANGGEVTGAGFYKFGETVYLNAARPGYQFAGWMSDDVELTDRGNTFISFVMPDYAVTLTAYWATSSAPAPSVPVLTGTLRFETNGGSAVNSISGVYGTKVDLTKVVTTREGYTFAGWYSDKALTKPVTQITLSATKTVYAGWIKNVTPDIPVVTMPFTDVAADAYYYNAVLWAVNSGITTGMTDTMFGPDLACTRAQVVTFLWRAAGCPIAKANDMPFADVSRDMYYHDAVLWAVEQGITNGISDTEFAPDAECSRAQIVTFLWRALGAPDAAADAGFVDVDTDAYYATAVEWAVDNGITNGMGDNTFGADADCTRGQTVTFLFRFFCK